MDLADASPTKRFFLEMLTRDIALEDAILDLMDNCIDSLSRTRKLPLSEVLLDERRRAPIQKQFKEDGLPRVDIHISDDQFAISDTCGGIEYQAALQDVFRFGRVADPGKARLSVYGIGLKRAIFKIGRQITIESKTEKDGFRLDLNVGRWAADEDDWTLPLEPISPARTAQSAGVRITVSDLNPEVKLRIKDDLLLGRLREFIATTYSLLLDRFVAVYLNGARVDPQPIPIGFSAQATAAREELEVGDVRVALLAGLAERSDGEWKSETAGWYVLCNGRVVLFADKGELTGWGIGSATFVSKYRGFVGIAFFFSEHPESLPWTTTKRGLNRESKAYILTRNRMSVISKPVITFLNKMYASGEIEEPAERAVANTVKPADLPMVMRVASGAFTVRAVQRTAPNTVSIQYKAKSADVDRIKKHLRKPTWSASRVGHHTFEHFLERECPE